MKRRKFLQNVSISGIGIAAGTSVIGCKNETEITHSKTDNKIILDSKKTLPVVVATWKVPNATNRAWELLAKNASSLDAVEQGVMVEEADIKNQSVGKGGLPDRDGNVTLDACIMDKDGNCGSVVYLKNITHAISVARKVMEDTPHVMLAGEGALQFAKEKGFQEEQLLTPKSKEAWEKWKETSQYKPIINIENHDTIGMLAIDKNGDISGACTTSGLAYKMNGRVGDSPIIGSGLFIDNEVGGAVGTGLGEEIIKTVGSFLIVELMRQGKSPQEACEEAVRRIVTKKNSGYKDFQACYVAINKQGEVGSYAIHEWFNYTVNRDGKSENIKSDYFDKSSDE